MPRVKRGRQAHHLRVVQTLWRPVNAHREIHRNPDALTMTDAEKIRELTACLGQLLDQIYPMKGLFPNDEALESAISDAEKALENNALDQ